MSFDFSFINGSKFEKAENDVSGLSIIFNNFRINIFCAWRIVDKNQILLANTDHGQLFGLPDKIEVGQSATTILSNTSVSMHEINLSTGDLNFQLSNGYEFQIFNNSSGYEAWSMVAKDKSFWSVSGGEVTST